VSQSNDDEAAGPKSAAGMHATLAGEDIHWDLGESLSYGDYLHLDELLRAQVPLSSGITTRCCSSSCTRHPNSG
jgi:hypothetical protein